MVRTTKFAAPVFGLRREIDKLFEDTFGNAGTPLLASNGRLAEDRLEITCEGGVLAVAGEKAAVRNEGDDGKWHIVERTFGSFRRSFQLPTNVQEDNIEATLTNGILHLRVPKMELPKPKKIEVKVEQK
ncbi:MAG: Hsp20/alpha crystallin family protein [Gemmatimonadaceae bacterium]|jgi:hypothetical protein